MRRLPIFLVIDVSESMIGEPLSQVGEGIRSMIQTLRRDPYALETVYLSVVIFAGKVKTLVPLTDIVNFYPPQLPVGGGTSLGGALTHLMKELDAKVVKTTAEVKGDWKPIVFIFTDGAPTDSPEQAVREWESKYRSRATVVAVSIGNNADATLLSRITDQVLIFNDARPESYQRFFKWITASVQMQSQRLESSTDDRFQADNLADDIVRKVDISKPPAQRVDDNYVVLVARCQQTKMMYLIKYTRQGPPGARAEEDDEWPDIIGDAEPRSPQAAARNYLLAGAFPVPSREDYEELTPPTYSAQTISTGELMGAPSCPCCGNPFGFGTCACGGIHCLAGPGQSVCPWCGKLSVYGFGEGDTDVTRSLG